MRIGLKLAVVLGLALAILVPVLMVRLVIADRQAYRAEVAEDVAMAYGGVQVVAGPVLTVPYVDTTETLEAVPGGAPRRVQHRTEGRWTFFPATLRATGDLAPDVRRRGVHAVRVYTWRGRLDARFDVRIPDDAPAGVQRRIGAPWLSYGVADPRGLRDLPRATVNGRAAALQAGFGARDDAGVHARLATPEAGSRVVLDTRMAMLLGGSTGISFSPLATHTTVALRSSWPHPAFEGVAPLSSRVDAGGFQANWSVAALATNAQAAYRSGQLPTGRLGSAPTMDVLGVQLVEPVDTYRLADRATKYGLLFVGLTFIGFFMLEVLRRLALHPVQYGLVGLALALFFLLLVSLGEHMPFAWAYAVASMACIALIAFYASAILASRRLGAAVAGLLALLYAALYGILASEDAALLLGSVLLFVVLAAVMAATRRIDWRQPAG